MEVENSPLGDETHLLEEFSTSMIMGGRVYISEFGCFEA